MSQMQVAKPGVNVYSTLGTSGYGYDSGTSMAAAFESAALAAG